MLKVECESEEKEKARHQFAIQRLARDLEIPKKEIEDLYHVLLEELNKTARIRDFISVLVSRRVKELLHHKRDKQAA